MVTPSSPPREDMDGFTDIMSKTVFKFILGNDGNIFGSSLKVIGNLRLFSEIFVWSSENF